MAKAASSRGITLATDGGSEEIDLSESESRYRMGVGR